MLFPTLAIRRTIPRLRSSWILHQRHLRMIRRVIPPNGARWFLNIHPTNIGFAHAGLDYRKHVINDPDLFRLAEVNRCLGATPKRKKTRLEESNWL